MVVDKITPKDIDRWLNHLKRKEYRPNRFSFKNELLLLKAVLNWHIKNNDKAKLALPIKARHSKLAKYKERPYPTEKNYLTSRELSRFLKALKILHPEVYDMAVVQNFQILRISEVVAMKWKHYNSKDKAYNFCESVDFVSSEGYTPKVKSGMKNLKAGMFLVKPLRKKVYQTLDRLKRKRDKRTLIFHNDGKIWTYKQIQYRYEKVFKMVGLHFRATHVLRRSGACDFLQATKGDVMALKDLGGWRSLSQVLLYGKLNGNYLKNAVKRADRY